MTVPNPETVETEPKDDAPESPAEEPKTDVTDADAEPADAGDDDDEPTTGLSGEALQKELDRARKEAKRYRTERNELREAAKNAKSPEDFAELERKLAEKDRELAVAKFEEKLPAEALPLLVALDSPETIKAQGDLLVSLLHAPKGRAPVPDADDLGGGLDPHDKGDDEPSTPAEIRAKYGPRRER